jgi:hypothetical protein
MISSQIKRAIWVYSCSIILWMKMTLPGVAREWPNIWVKKLSWVQYCQIMILWMGVNPIAMVHSALYILFSQIVVWPVDRKSLKGQQASLWERCPQER